MMTERLLETAEKTVRLASKEKIDQVQVTAFIRDSALTRFANSQIHQNVASKAGGVVIKVVKDKRIGTLRINSLEDAQIRNGVKKVVGIARVTPPNKDFKSLPQPQKWTPVRGVFDRETAECSPDYRAARVKEVIEIAHSKSPKVKAVAGSFSTGSMAFAVSNSLGVSAWAELSLASVATTVISRVGGSQGFGSWEQHSRRVKDLDAVAVASRAAERSVQSVNPSKLPPGEYEVVLSPLAVSTFVAFLGFIGFSATLYQDGESFVKYHLNERVFDEKLTVKDDARDLKTLYTVPVDGEGVPKRKTRLIEKGVVSENSICYDSLTAGREKKESTGHAPPPFLGFGYLRPAPFNTIASPGDSSVEEMIADTQHGIFVTRFHYTNPVEPTKAILTGLTRDGTFLIEKGEISKPVMNLRYTDSMLSTLRGIPLVGKELECLEGITVPAMKLEKLRFTGVTEY